MTLQVTAESSVRVNARFEVNFTLPPGMGGLELQRMSGFKEPDQYTLQLSVIGATLEEAQEGLRALRDHLVKVLQEQA